MDESKEKKAITIYRNDLNPIIISKENILEKYKNIGITKLQAEEIFNSDHYFFNLINGHLEIVDKIKDSLDNYNVIKVLGKGLFGTVYLISDKKEGKFYALKSINKKEDILRTALKEIQVFLLLRDCPNVIKMISFFETKSTFYLVYEYMDGGDLYQKNLTVQQVKFILKSILKGLECIHSKNLIYADLKPENIMTNKDLTKIVIIDLGSIRENPFYHDFGTTYYMAPERFENDATCDEKVDSWTIGVLTYALLTGDELFDADTEVGTALKIKECEYDLHLWLDEYDPNLRDFISKLVVLDPKKRLSLKEIKNHPFLN